MGFGGGSSGLASPNPILMFQKIEAYKAAAAELSKTFTLPTSFQDADNVLEYHIIIDGSNQGLNSEIRCTINNVTTLLRYFNAGSRQQMITGAVTDYTLGNIDRGFIIMDTTILDNNGNRFHAHAMISNSKDSTQPRQYFESLAMNNGVNVWNLRNVGGFSIDAGNITRIDVVSGVNWDIGTKITLYALMRNPT